MEHLKYWFSHYNNNNDDVNHLQISTLVPEMGKNAKERNKSIGDLISELNVIEKKLRHPNIVRYKSTFEESK